MPCYSPLKGYRSNIPTQKGKFKIVFSENLGYKDLPVTVPCGQCVGCRLEKSRQWAVRCLHESQLHAENSFLTLTYSDHKLPTHGSLVPEHHQKFIKRLRKRYSGKKIRYFHCGEYGDSTDRPHYHTLLFGHNFADRKFLKMSGDKPIFISDTLDSIWGYGQAYIGAVEFESAAYVARYALKKVTGDKAEAHYKSLNPHTGEVFDIEPEYITMSRRPGIGKEWFEKYKTEIYPEDVLVVGGVKMKAPTYYDYLREKEDDSLQLLTREQRKIKSIGNQWNNTPERLKVRETITKSRLNLKQRTL